MSEGESHWTFLTNHAHVILCLATEPELVMREVATRVGITERAVQRIVHDLVEDGYLEKAKHGRANMYRLNRDKRLRHRLEQHCSIGNLLQSLSTGARPGH